ncbi:MAG: hypothetical protein AAGH68_05490 [Pseudomonadota bacterium]
MAGRFLFGLMVVLAQPHWAEAGAWTQPEDRGIIIITGSRTVTPVRAWFGGVIEEDTSSQGMFLEYGLWDDLTVGVTTFAEYGNAGEIFEARAGVHARHRIWTGEAGDVASVQVGVSVPTERWFGSTLGDDRPDSATEVDFRVLYGRGWQWDLGNSFVSGELGLRIRAEGLDEQLRFDMTVGHEVWDGYLFLGSVFSSFPLGKRDEVSIKLSPSFAFTLWPRLAANEKKPWRPFYPTTLQTGLTWDASQPNSGMEVGMSIWNRF